MSNKYLGRDTLRLCQYPVSQRPIPRCGISASPLQTLSPGSSYSKFLLSLFCVYYLEFLRGNSFYFLLYLFLMVYFYQHGYLFYSLGCCNRSLYFILLLNLFQFWPLEVFSGCLLCSLSGTSPCYFFPSVLSTFSVLALHNVPAHRVLLLPPSWKHPRLQGIAVLSFGSLENGICGVSTQRDELVLPDVLLPDTLADS